MSPVDAAAPTRREAQRAATLGQIRRTARRLLAAEGKPGVTMRPIAKAVGLTAPALYRYYDSHEALLLDLVADLYAEVADVLVVARDADPGALSVDRAQAMVAAFRAWALAHPREFELVFATPMLHTGAEPTRLSECGDRFGRAFYDLFAAMWEAAPFPVPAEDELDPGLCEQVAAWSRSTGSTLPIGAGAVFLGCWVRIYGLISLEVFGQLTFALTDVTPMYDLLMADLARMVGLAPPRSRLG